MFGFVTYPFLILGTGPYLQGALGPGERGLHHQLATMCCISSTDTGLKAAVITLRDSVVTSASKITTQKTVISIANQSQIVIPATPKLETKSVFLGKLVRTVTHVSQITTQQTVM